ncbi:claudin-34 [Boleophthalmus pectinirostris]|uniref:claudin-34 n=1 Tax=Boleophthalmus pectinirostris TaxID=150288 RepID=UPI000A1C6382|nr:claudin-34 [Boleophthalmus pectinirostris]
MLYIAHTAHWQFFALVVGFLSWIITLATTGLNQWRIWFVNNTTVINSGVAWVGIWRACFYSHVLSEIEYCQYLSITESFLPTEIKVAQVLIMLALITGLVGNMVAANGMRLAYFSVENRSRIKLFFPLAGTIYLFTGFCSLLPIAWNLNSVLNNHTIDFPPEYHFPAAPVSQKVGNAIIVGAFSSVLMLLSGLTFLCYRYGWQTLKTETLKDPSDPLCGPWTQTSLGSSSGQQPNGGTKGRDNAAFQLEEMS